MKLVEEPTEDRPSGLSRRQLFCRLAGGYAGAVLASVGLGGGRKAAAAPGPISLRDLLRRISDKGCDPSHGIRVGLPNDHPSISLRAVAGRYANSVVDFCQPLQFSVREEKLPVGLRAYLTGANFTGGGTAAMYYWSDLPEERFNFSIQVRPDGTFAHVMDLGCTSSGKALYSLEATDAATGRKTATPRREYICPQAPPPPPPPPPPTPPSISVSRQGATFTVTGMGFLSGHQILIRVVDPATFVGNYYNTNSDAAGKLSFSVSPPCPPSGQLAFSASDSRSVSTSQDRTGMLWSNTLTLACS